MAAGVTFKRLETNLEELTISFIPEEEK